MKSPLVAGIGLLADEDADIRDTGIIGILAFRVLSCHVDTHKKAGPECITSVSLKLIQLSDI